MDKPQLDQIAQAIVELEEERALALTQQALDAGIDPPAIINEGIVAGLDVIGKGFGNGEFFLLELQLGGDIADACIKLVTPHLATGQVETRGKVVLATVEGDLHNVGKNLVGIQLGIGGYEVDDLGIDVPAMTIISRARETDADVIALSSLLLTTLPKQAEVIRNLTELGLRDKFKVIIGGGPTTREYAEQIGADGWAGDAYGAVAELNRIMGEGAA